LLLQASPSACRCARTCVHFPHFAFGGAPVHLDEVELAVVLRQHQANVPRILDHGLDAGVSVLFLLEVGPRVQAAPQTAVLARVWSIKRAREPGHGVAPPLARKAHFLPITPALLVQNPLLLCLGAQTEREKQSSMLGGAFLASLLVSRKHTHTHPYAQTHTRVRTRTHTHTHAHKYTRTEKLCTQSHLHTHENRQKISHRQVRKQVHARPTHLEDLLNAFESGGQHHHGLLHKHSRRPHVLSVPHGLFRNLTLLAFEFPWARVQPVRLWAGLGKRVPA
jgi:hypothetical protein